MRNRYNYTAGGREMKKNRREAEGKTSIWLNGMVGLLLVILIGVVVICVQRNQDMVSKTDVKEVTELVSEQGLEKWQEGIVSYNGKHYKYNSSLKNYLYLGIDKEEPVQAASDGISGGQSDALFLIVMNEQEETLSVIAINRNTMTDIQIYDEAGKYVGTQTAQLCLQHGYGDGMRTSCSRTVDAVSHLFYNLPVNGYISMNMGAIPQLNDAVGGVRLKVLEDINDTTHNINLKAGEDVQLAGNEAYSYLRNRDITEFDSASKRLERQMQYIGSFIAQAKQAAAQDTSVILSTYHAIENYLVTNIDFTSFAKEAVKCDFSTDNIYSIPGETVMGTQFEEYYADDTKLYELMLDLFYEQVE